MHLSLLKTSTKVVCLIAAMFPTQLLSAPVCRLTQLPVLKLEFVFTGGTTPKSAVLYFVFFLFVSSQYYQRVTISTFLL